MTTDPIEATLRAAGWTDTTVTPGTRDTDLYLSEHGGRLTGSIDVHPSSSLAGKPALRPPLPTGTIVRSKKTGIIRMLTRPKGDRDRRWIDQFGHVYDGELPNHFRIIYTPTDTSNTTDEEPTS